MVVIVRRVLKDVGVVLKKYLLESGVERGYVFEYSAYAPLLKRPFPTLLA